MTVTRSSARFSIEYRAPDWAGRAKVRCKIPSRISDRSVAEEYDRLWRQYMRDVFTYGRTPTADELDDLSLHTRTLETFEAALRKYLSAVKADRMLATPFAHALESGA